MNEDKELIELIAFVFSHCEDIKQAVYEARNDDASRRRTIEGIVSRPTETAAIKAASEVQSVYVSYGARVCKRRREKKIKYPERWLALIELLNVRCESPITKAILDGILKDLYTDDVWFNNIREHYDISSQWIYSEYDNIMLLAQGYVMGAGLAETPINPKKSMKAG